MKVMFSLLSIGLLAALTHSASAQTLEWSSAAGGAATLTVTGAGWGQPAVMPGSQPVAMTSVGSATSAGQHIHAVITSNFLFTSPPEGFHLVMALNYSPVYSYSDWYWTYSYMGNQASALTIGDAQNSYQDAPCARGARFEAIYQIPNYGYYSWYPFGVTAGANGQPNALAQCAPLLSGPTTGGGSEHQMYVSFSSRYDGSTNLMTSPSPGSFVIATANHNWASWFAAATGAGVPRHTGVGLAPIGNFPPNSYIRIQILGVSEL